MRNDIVMDQKLVIGILNQIELMIERDRAQIDSIVEKHKDVSSFDKLNKGKDLLKVYAEAADDYARISFMQTGVSESLLDLKSIKKELAEGGAVLPSQIKPLKYRVDYLVESLNIFKEAITSAKQGMEAKVRYYNSVSYVSYDKMMGPKC